MTAPPLPPKPVLTIDEVADWLGMHRNSVHRAARQGRLPARRVGKEWRFLAEAVAARWTAGRRLRGPADAMLEGPAFPESPVELSALRRRCADHLDRHGARRRVEGGADLLVGVAVYGGVHSTVRVSG